MSAPCPPSLCVLSPLRAPPGQSHRGPAPSLTPHLGHTPAWQAPPARSFPPAPLLLGGFWIPGPWACARPDWQVQEDGRARPRCCPLPTKPGVTCSVCDRQAARLALKLRPQPLRGAEKARVLLTEVICVPAQVKPGSPEPQLGGGVLLPLGPGLWSWGWLPWGHLTLQGRPVGAGPWRAVSALRCDGLGSQGQKGSRERTTPKSRPGRWVSVQSGLQAA